MTLALFPPRQRRSLRPRGRVVVAAFALSMTPLSVSAAPPQSESASTESNPVARSRVTPKEGSKRKAARERKNEKREGKGGMVNRDEKAPRVAMAPAEDKARPTSGQPVRKSGSAAERTKTRSDDRRAGSGERSDARQNRRSRPASDRSRGSKKISIEDDFLIEGKLEKPSAYYILRRSRAEYDWARLDAKFLPLVLESVQDPLF